MIDGFPDGVWVPVEFNRAMGSSGEFIFPIVKG